MASQVEHGPAGEIPLKGPMDAAPPPPAKKVDGRSKSSALNGKKYGGRAFTRAEPGDVIEFAARQALDATGAVIGQLPAVKLSQYQIQALKELTGLAPDQYRDLVATKMEEISVLVLQRLKDEYMNLAPRDLPITFGILNDHLLKTRGFGAPAVLNQTNIQINGVSRADALKTLTGGRKAIRVIDCKGDAVDEVNNRFSPAPESEQREIESQ